MFSSYLSILSSTLIGATLTYLLTRPIHYTLKKKDFSLSKSTTDFRDNRINERHYLNLNESM